MKLRGDDGAPVVQSRGESQHAEQLSNESLFGVGHGDQVAGFESDGPETSLEFDVGISANRFIQL